MRRRAVEEPLQSRATPFDELLIRMINIHIRNASKTKGLMNDGVTRVLVGKGPDAAM